MRSITEHASDLDCAFVASGCGFLCLIGARWSLTLNTRFGSFINALAYWSSVIQIRIRKLSFTVWWDESDLVSYEFKESYINIRILITYSTSKSPISMTDFNRTCITIEQYSRKVTRRLLGLDDIRSVDVSVDMSAEGSWVIDVPEGDWDEDEVKLIAFSLDGLPFTLSAPVDNALSGVRGDCVGIFVVDAADSVW